MSDLGTLLPDIWLLLIGFLLLYYAVTDGANLGVGMLSLFSRDERERGLHIGAIQGTWHNAQTWLVLLGGMLFGAFPLFYGLILSALYLPLLAMLVGLIFRGVAMEFREHSPRKAAWGALFGAGSAVAAIGQGAALGGLLSGSLETRGGQFVGSIWAWANPYGLLVCLGVVLGYAMLGANFLILKTEGRLQRLSFRWAWIASTLTLAVSLAVHTWTVLRYPHVADKWSGSPETLRVALFPVLAGITYGLYFLSLWRRRERAPLLWNTLLLVFSFVGLSVGFYPDMIPGLISSPLSIQEAAASPKTLSFMLAVVAILLPVILGS